MAFKDILKTSLDALEDFSQLNVQTFTGDLKGVVKGKALGNDWKAAIEAATVDGTLELVAMTNVKPDGDIDQFLATDLPVSLEQAHLKAVASGTAARSAMIDMARQIIFGKE